MEEKEDTIVYEFEDCDNGSTLCDPINTGMKEVALFGNTKDKVYDDIRKMLGKWLHEDIKAFMDEQLTSKVKITIKFEKIDD